MARRRSGNRLKYQVEQAVNKVNFIGQSKRKARDEGKSGIHSTTQVKHVLSTSQNFAKWAKQQHGVSDLYKLNQTHYKEYIEHMRNSGVSNGHLINIETNLRILSKGMAAVSADKGIKARNWVPEERVISSSMREKPKNRALDRDENSRIRESLSDNMRIAHDLSNAFGLRLRETANSNVAHIKEFKGKLYWRAVKDPSALNTAVGVTKAGKRRIVPVKPGYEAVVREMIRGKAPHEKICNVSYNTIKSAYYRLGVDGNHAFRHTFARDMVLLEFERRGIASEGRQMLQRMLENRSAGFRKDHLVKRDERALYKEVNKAVDKVHKLLGHGRGRIDLCEVYMSF